LDALKARYDSQKVPAPIFEVIRDLEIEIAWQQHSKEATPPQASNPERTR
jgi:hypothetical protein